MTTSPIGSNTRSAEFVVRSSELVTLRTLNYELRTLRGFTLVEVVLVAVVLGVLLLGSVPGFQRTARRLRLEQAAFELAAFARLARERAVNEGRAIVWTWDDQRLRARIEPAEGASEADGDLPERLESGALPADVAVTLQQDGVDVECRCAKFFPEGTAEAAVVTLESAEQTYRMIIDATGRTTVAAGPAPH